MAWIPDPSMIITAEEKAVEARKGMSISSRQFRLQLHASGKSTQFGLWIVLQPQATQITFQYGDRFRRSDPAVIAALANLGMTEAAMDAFFQAAAQL